MTNEWFRILKSRNRSVSRGNLKEFRRITRPVIQEFVDDFVSSWTKVMNADRFDLN